MLAYLLSRSSAGCSYRLVSVSHDHDDHDDDDDVGDCGAGNEVVRCKCVHPLRCLHTPNGSGTRFPLISRANRLYCAPRLAFAIYDAMGC